MAQRFGDGSARCLPLVRCHSAAPTKAPATTALRASEEVTGAGAARVWT